MSKPITKDVIHAAVVEAASSVGSPAEVAQAVLANPTIAKATTPISRLASETMQGLATAGAAQILQLTGLAKTIVILAGAFGQTWNPDDVSTVATTVLTFAGLLWAWYGRETTSRPLA